MTTDYSDEYGALREIKFAISYLTIRRSDIYKRTNDGRLPPFVKIGPRNRLVNGELREIRHALTRNPTDDEIRKLVRQLVSIRPLLQGRSEDEIRALIRNFAATDQRQTAAPADAVPTPTLSRATRGRPKTMKVA